METNASNPHPAPAVAVSGGTARPGGGGGQSDTPETDHLEKALGTPIHPTMLMLTRRLERERDQWHALHTELLRELAAVKQSLRRGAETAARMLEVTVNERDEARRRLQKLLDELS